MVKGPTFKKEKERREEKKKGRKKELEATEAAVREGVPGAGERRHSFWLLILN